MMTTLPVPRNIVSLSGMMLLLFLFTETAQAQDAYCDPRLGRDYDAQTIEVKMTRMSLYFDCRQSQDIRFLEALRRDILTGVQRWQSRATIVIRSSLSSKRYTGETELTTAQRMQKIELDADYDSRFTAIEATRSNDNTQQIAEQRRETNTEYRSDRATMMSRHRQEIGVLRSTMTQCSQLSNQQIRQMLGAETLSISQQFLDKVGWLKREYSVLSEAQMMESPNDYTARRQNNNTLVAQTTDSTPVGEIGTMEGSGTVTRPNGETVPAVSGTPIGMGDTVNMDEGSSCELVLVDNSTVAVIEGGRMEIDEYVYDPDGDEKGRFSLLRSIFIFTSGLIGRKEVNDVNVEVGYGSGIRG